MEDFWWHECVTSYICVWLRGASRSRVRYYTVPYNGFVLVSTDANCLLSAAVHLKRPPQQGDGDEQETCMTPAEGRWVVVIT